MRVPPVLAIVGATGVGKTEVALELADMLDGEIISADSRQIYRHLDIGTAKPSGDELARVPHHLIDVAEPDEVFDASRFGHMARAAIDDVIRRGRVPIVCGGTGLYLRALVEGLLEGAPPSPTLRAEFLAREESEGRGTLHALLAAEDPTTATRLHPHDLFRIVRALEVGRLTGRPMSAWQREHGFRERLLDAVIIGCERPREELAVRVEARCRAMLEAGLLTEIEGLWSAGFSPALPALRSVGYLEMGRLLRGGVAFDSAFEDFVRATMRLAKRQRTWFHGQTDARWFHPDRDRGDIRDAARTWFDHSWRAPISTSNAHSPR